MTPINAAMTILPETSLIEQRRTRAIEALVVLLFSLEHESGTNTD